MFRPTVVTTRGDDYLFVQPPSADPAPVPRCIRPRPALLRAIIFGHHPAPDAHLALKGNKSYVSTAFSVFSTLAFDLMQGFHILLCACVLSTVLPRGATAQNSKENADFKLAINLYHDGLFDLAAEQLKQFIGSYPSSTQGIEARYYLGLTQLKLKQYEDARLTFQTFALTYQDNPKAPEAWWNVGESYAAVHNYREAALAFERVKVFHARSALAPDALLRASRYFSLAGEPENARRLLRSVLQEYPASGSVLPARTLLGRMYFEEGNLAQAQDELKRVIEGDPSPDARAEALLVLGGIYQAGGRTDQAQSMYQEIIAKHKTSLAAAEASLNLGTIEAGAGKFADAVGHYQKVLLSKPDSLLEGEALRKIGDAHAALNDHANAVSSYAKFITRYPANEHIPEILWKSASEYCKARNFTKSNEACNRILNSSAPPVLKRRAQAKLALNAQQEGNAARAVQLYALFLDQYPDDPLAPEVLMRIAELTDKEGRDPRRAAASYELLETRYPQSPLADDATYRAAASCEVLKDFEKALQLYKELVTRFPASDFRQQAEERIRMIETFETKEKDAGLEKLALLVGDVVGEKDKVGLAYRLGEIYFNDLKNYEAAAAQFTNAINSGMTDSRFVDALYLRAKAYTFLTWKDEKFRKPAIDAYETFLHSYPTDPRSGDASATLFLLSTTSRASSVTALATHPDLATRDTVLLRLGTLQEADGSTDEALATYSTIVKNHPSTPSAEEAGYRGARLMLKRGPGDSAEVAARDYIDTYPSAPHTAEVLGELARRALERGDGERAAKLYGRLHDEFPYTAAARGVQERLARAYVMTGDYPGALRLYGEMRERQATNPLTDGAIDPLLLFTLGTTEQLAGNARGAKVYLLQALTHQPTRELAAEIYNHLGSISRDEGAIDLATSFYRQAGTMSPATAANRDVANLLFDAGNYSDAIGQYTQLLQTAKTDTESRFYESRVIVARLRTDAFAAAQANIAAFAKKYRQTDEDMATFEVEKGNYFYRKENYGEAMKAYNRVMDKYSESTAAPPAMYWIGKILQATDKPQEAIEQLTKLLTDFPGSPITSRAHLALGNLYYNVEKWDESIKHYKAVIDNPQADPTLLPLATSNLIETYEAAGVFDAALSTTRRYLELYPQSDDSFDKKIKIGILYQRLGYNDQSVLHLQSLLDQAGSDLEGEIRYYIAEGNYNKGDYQQAILDFLKVPYLVTKKGKIDWTANSLYMSGQSYEKMGRYDQALTMYQQIIDRPGIDQTFKTAAKKEIDRVKLVLKKSPN